MKILALLSFLFFVSPSDWGLDIEKAKAEATSSKKMILINFSGSDWCGPCIQLKREVFESDAFKKFATDNLVLVRADFPRLKKNQLDKKQTLHNETLAEKYNQQGKFPLTVLVDSKGKVVREWDGFQANTQVFIQEIQDALKK
ncbi:MAG: thioredoxin family protein [Spirosomataceae bacterium]